MHKSMTKKKVKHAYRYLPRGLTALVLPKLKADPNPEVDWPRPNDGFVVPNPIGRTALVG